MFKASKFMLLGLGLGLIISSFFVPNTLKATEDSKDIQSTNGVNFVLEDRAADKSDPDITSQSINQQGDSYTQPVAHYMGRDLYLDNNAISLQQESNNVEVIIPPGAISSDVAAVLFDKGLIASKLEFNARIIGLNLDSKIRYGVYRIEIGESIDSIINKITIKSNN